MLRSQPNPTELTAIARTLVEDRARLDIDAARTLYLFGPGLIPDGKVVHKVRSSLEAALADVRTVVGRDSSGHVQIPDRSRSWIGACGYLMLIDQLATTFNFPDDFKGLLQSELVGLDAADAGAIYALRCAFLHNYGLVNDFKSRKDERVRQLRHTFNLTIGTESLVKVGDRSEVLTRPLANLPPTVVDLGRLGDYVEAVVVEIRARHLRGEPLPWRVNDVDRFVGLSFFHHLDSMTPE